MKHANRLSSFTSVSVEVLGVCTFKFVLKNERLCKDFDSFRGLSVTVRHHLNSLETARAAQMTEDGLSRTLGVPPNVLTLWACYLETDNYSRRAGQGRPRTTTDVQDRYLRV